MKTIKFFSTLFIATAIMFVSCNSEHDLPEIPIPEVSTKAVSFTDDELQVLMQMRNPDNKIDIEEATGGNGSQNGYFAAGSFDSNRRSELSNATRGTVGEDYNFRFRNRIFTNIRR